MKVKMYIALVNPNLDLLITIKYDLHMIILSKLIIPHSKHPDPNPLKKVSSCIAYCCLIRKPAIYIFCIRWYTGSPVFQFLIELC